MAAWSEMSVGARGGVVAGVAAVIALLLYGAWSLRPEAPAPEAVAVVQPAEGPVEETTAEADEAPAEAEEVVAAEAAAEVGAEGTAESAATEPAAETVSGAEGADEPVTDEEAALAAPVAESPAAPEVAVPEAAAEDPAAAKPAVIAPPVFDLVRVEKDGSALVAGTALPAAGISLRINGEEIVSVPADGAGKFVAMFNLAPSDAPRMLGMVMVLADGTEVRSTQTVAIAPTLAPAPDGVAVAEAEAGTEAGSATEGAPEAETVAPAALLVTEEGAKVLQSAEALPEMALNVTVDSISYSPEGDVQLAGRGTAGSVVRVYLDNAQKGDGLIAAGGDWNLTLLAVEPGIYTLRVDQLDGSGKVTSRFETPFKRETVEALAAAAAAAEQAVPADAGAEAGADAGAGAAPAAASGPVSITVQPGFTLWAIARENLGDGVLYVQVFEANKAQIKDPDLIYPGQVFSIPKP